MTAGARVAIHVPGAPAIVGLEFRRFRGPRDYPGMVDANRAARKAYGVHDPVSVESMTAQYVLDSVAVRRPWRRRGLARALIARSLRLLGRRGATSAFLSVDAENPNQAMTLYEGCGFRVASSATTWRKPLSSAP